MAAAGRLSVLAGAVMALTGVIDHSVHWPLLTATLGPTAYLFAAHPDSISSRRRNAVAGHTAAILSGLVWLWVFGLWHEPSAAVSGHLQLTQAFATGAGLATTLFVLEVFDLHHAPAAASLVLVTTGLARPGRPLYALISGLALIVVASPLLAWSPVPETNPRRSRGA